VTLATRSISGMSPARPRAVLPFELLADTQYAGSSPARDYRRSNRVGAQFPARLPLVGLLATCRAAPR